MSLATRMRMSTGSTFNPLTAIGWHTAVWASDPLWTNPGDGNAVSSWRDGSGNSRTLTQGSAPAQPIFRASIAGYNNKPTVEFNTTSHDLASPSFTAVTQPYSVVVVGNLGSTSSFRVLWYGMTSSAPPFTTLGKGSAAPFYLYANGSALTVSTVTADTSPRFFGGVFNAASSTIIVNNVVTAGTEAALTGAATQFWLNSNALITNFGGGNRAFAGLYVGDITSHPQWA